MPVPVGARIFQAQSVPVPVGALRIFQAQSVPVPVCDRIFQAPMVPGTVGARLFPVPDRRCPVPGKPVCHDRLG